jgi:hypothetical protein
MAKERISISWLSISASITNHGKVAPGKNKKKGVLTHIV